MVNLEANFEYSHEKKQLNINGNYVRPDIYGSDIPNVVMFHGGSLTKGHEILSPVQFGLAERGIGSLAISFPGLGMSSGDVAENTLELRAKIGSTAIDYLFTTYQVNARRLVLWGTSMGADAAIKNGLFFDAKVVILHGGAVYHEKTFDKKFNGDFSAAIRTYPWSESVVFDIIREYQGRICAIYGERDIVVPLDIRNAVEKVLKIESGDSFEVIPEAVHDYLTKKNERDISRLIDISSRFILNYV